MKEVVGMDKQQYIESFELEIEEDAKKLMLEEMPILTYEDFMLYEQTGNRLIYENIYFERRHFLKVFGLVLLWNKKKCYIDKLEYIIKEICLENTWALPAHVNKKEENWKETVDLFSCETGHALSLIIKEFDDLLSEEIKETVVFHLKKRLLDSFMSKKEGSWRWESFENNWIAVCAGSVGCIAMDLYQVNHEIVERAKRAMPNYLKSFCEDGTCLEGLDYYNYGLSYYFAFARQLYEETNGKNDFVHSSHLEHIARFQQLCYLNNGLTVSFSDSNATSKFRMGILCYMSSLYEGVTFPPMDCVMTLVSDHCYRYTSAYQDYKWSKEYLGNLSQKEDQVLNCLEQAQWAIWKYKQYGIALKGGHNEEPHNHNDIGSFLYSVAGEIFLSDLGSGEYTKAYFQEETRYQHITTRSRGHNVPIVNDQEQTSGKQYKASDFKQVGVSGISMQLEDTYDVFALSSLKRETLFDQETQIFCLKDSVVWKEAFAERNKLQENFMTYIEPEVVGNVVNLFGDKGTCKMIMNGIDEIRSYKQTFIDHRGNEKIVWTILCEVKTTENRASFDLEISYKQHGDDKEIKK